MKEQPRACAILGLGPFGVSALDGVAPGAFRGPVIPLQIPRATSRSGHDWLPRSLDPAALPGTRPGRRLDLLTVGRNLVRPHEVPLRHFANACRAAGVPGAIVLVGALFDPEAASLLDLGALLRASEATAGLSLHAVLALRPPTEADEPRASARAALALRELAAADAGGDWELPQPGGVLRASQAGLPWDSVGLCWPGGPRWSAAEATGAVLDALASVPWLPEIPTGLWAARALPVHAPAPALRDRLADRLTAAAVDRWLAPPAAPLPLPEARLLAGRPSEDGVDWFAGVRRRAEAVVAGAREAGDAEAAADGVRGAVPQLERDLRAEVGPGGPMRRAVDDAARRWLAAVRVQALAVARELAAADSGGGFLLIEAAQQAEERLGVLRDQAEAQARADVKGAMEALEEATEALRVAIDKPAAWTVRLLDRKGGRLLAPLQTWLDALLSWASAVQAQSVARAEAHVLSTLARELGQAALPLQGFELALRKAAVGLGRSARAANQEPARGVLVLPGGAVDADDAADALAESLGAGALGLGGGPLEQLLGDPAPVLLELRERLRDRLGPAEASITLAGALGSLPERGGARQALDEGVRSALAPLLPGATEERVAVLPPDVVPSALRLPEGTAVVRRSRSDDALLVTLAGGFPLETLGLRKAALDEGLTRLRERVGPSDPDLAWERFPA